MKKLCYVASVVCLLSMSMIPVEALGTIENTSAVIQQKESEISVYASVIERVFRVADDKVQYRDWNRTWENGFSLTGLLYNP